jgi:hypothetical protein
VANAYNPSYSESRDQEDHGLKPAQANSLRDPILKKSYHNERAGGVAQVVERLPSKCEAKVKPQYHKKVLYVKG